MNAKAVILSVFLVSLFALGTLRLLSTRQVVIAGVEQALIATVKLSSGGMGTSEERRRIVALEDQLSDAIRKSAAGELDGDEFGAGVCTIYMYGPSAERLFAVAIPILKTFHAPAGSYVSGMESRVQGKTASP